MPLYRHRFVHTSGLTWPVIDITAETPHQAAEHARNNLNAALVGDPIGPAGWELAEQAEVVDEQPEPPAPSPVSQPASVKGPWGFE